ncbi:hypothetical protein EXU57_11045 [Segetibacter sp. 3557_3]|nr:FG-GAP-like repeat-containing protein [Segetibacter sp. 3557_3]TDH26617.1 hypothetical protein EXU57_11045 [Segetibacter sp. 3557_3]
MKRKILLVLCISFIFLVNLKAQRGSERFKEHRKPVAAAGDLAGVWKSESISIRQNHTYAVAANKWKMLSTTPGTTSGVSPEIITSPGVTDTKRSPAIDTSLLVLDADNLTLSSAQVSFTTNFVSGQDRLNFVNNSAVLHGNIVGTYNVATGMLSLQSPGATATLGQWQNVLRSVFYQNFSVEPNTQNRTLSFVVNDGTTNSNIATKEITVPNYNAAPVLAGSAGNLSIIEGNNAPTQFISVFPTLTVSDPDGDDAITFLTVHASPLFSGTPVFDQELRFVNDGATMGNIIGTDETPFLKLASAGNTATLAEWQSALRSLSFGVTSDKPANAHWMVSVNGFIARGASIFGPQVVVAITSVNDDPVLTTSTGQTNFVPGSPATAVIVDNALVVSDLDNEALSTAAVSISNNFVAGEDFLLFTPSAQTGNISGSYNPATGVLNLVSEQATATLAQWQAALRSVAYNNNSTSPGHQSRTVTFVVNDGTTNSAAAGKEVEISHRTTAEPPIILSFSPGAAPVGTTVTITGQHFNNLPSANVVYFGAVQATVTSASPTSLTVTVPAGATYKPISVLNRANGLTGYSAQFFVTTFINPFATGIPTTFYQPGVELLSPSLRSIAIGDLDGDGKPEVVSLGNGEVVVLRNISNPGATSIGPASFEQPVSFPVSTSINAGTVLLSDVDGDGKLDIIVPNYATSTVSVLRNTSVSQGITNTSFAPKVEFSTDQYVISVTSGDIDGDGKPELVTISPYFVSVFHNLATPGVINTTSFAPRVSLQGLNPNDVGLATVRIADVDGDNKPDIIAHTNRIFVFRNKAIPGVITASSFAPLVDLNMTGVKTFEVGDVDGDGKLDLAVIRDPYTAPDGNSAGRIAIAHNRATPGSITAESFAPGVDFDTPYDVWALALGDLDGDSKPDMAVSTTSRMVVFRNTATPGLINNQSYSPAIIFPGFWSNIAVGDVDADGIPEVFTSTWPTNRLSVYKISNAANRVTFSGKVYLQGSYNPSSGTMNNILNTSGILGKAARHHPYNGIWFKYAGREKVTSAFYEAHPEIVDWVLVEIRGGSSPSTVLATRAAFVKRDGTLVDINGTDAAITFEGISPGIYYVAIRHRNHLGIRSSTPVDFTSRNGVFDFTIGSEKAFQSQDYTSTVQVGQVWAMRAGNANSNNNVKYNGPQNDQDRILNAKLGGSLSLVLSDQYSVEDVNMDGTVKSNGPGNDQNYLLNIILGGLLSRIYLEQL